MAGKKGESVSMRVPGVDESQAVPASRTLNTQNPADQRDTIKLLAGTHVFGKPIEEWASTATQEQINRMCYATTDEGLALQRRILNERDNRLPMGQTASDAQDKRVLEYRDGLAAGNLLTGQDPMLAIMEKHTPDGHSGLWIGKERERHDGLQRGVVAYEPVMLPDGQGGFKRVELGGMYLASIPKELKKQADAYYQGIGKARQGEVQERVQEQTEKIFGDDGMRNLARKQPGMNDFLSGVTVDEPDGADQEVAAMLPHEED